MNFYKKMFFSGIISNMGSMGISLMFSIYVAQSHNARVVGTFGSIFILGLCLQLFVAPLVDRLVYGGVSKEYDRFLLGLLSETEKTELLERLFQKPWVASVKVLCYFLPCSFLLFFLLENLGETERHYNLLVLSYSVAASLYAGIMSFDYANRVCSEFACPVVASGVDRKYVEQRKIFGASMHVQIWIYIIVPILITVAMLTFVMLLGYYPFDDHTLWVSFEVQSRRMVFSILLNILCTGVPLTMFFLHFRSNNSKLSDIFEGIGDDTLAKKELLDVDLRDDISYSYYMMNELILYLRKIILDSAEIGSNISDMAKSLLDISNETETNALKQETGVRNVREGVEASTARLSAIKEDLRQIKELSENSAKNVRHGLEALRGNMERIAEISKINDSSVLEIKELNAKINNIWEIVNIINSIVDQTKIIAFNAELEAASIPESGGKNFNNVSNEIRRLANNTIDSTIEIKNRIGEMQTTANTLLRGAMNNTATIQQGYAMTMALEGRFLRVNEYAESSAFSANEIKSLVEQQLEAFTQITGLINSISLGLGKFSELTRSIVSASNSLEQNSMKLNQLVEAAK